MAHSGPAHPVPDAAPAAPYGHDEWAVELYAVA